MSRTKTLTKAIIPKITKSRHRNTQKEIAKWLKISESYLSLILKQKRPIPKRLESKFKILAHGTNGNIYKFSKN